MLLQTHLDLSKLIHKAIEDHTGINLDKMAFSFGNIKPDLVRDSYLPQTDNDKIIVSHYMDDAYPYVCTAIYELIEWTVSEKQVNSRLFAVRLGVIMHYICDFFCHAHSSKFPNHSLLHHLYEWQFAFFIKDAKKDFSNQKGIGLVPLYNDYYDIVASIHDIQNQYLTRMPSYALDAQYALKCSIATSVSILQVVLSKTKKIAA